MKVNITRQFERSILGSTGELTDIVHIEFTVGDYGPFTVEIPKSEYTPESAQTWINKLAKTIATTAKGWEV